MAPSALGKIAGGAARVHNPDAERNPATAHMFIINPLSEERMDNLFSTHPNTENRIRALREMAGGGGARFEGPVRADPPGPWGRRGAGTGGTRADGPASRGPWG